MKRAGFLLFFLAAWAVAQDAPTAPIQLPADSDTPITLEVTRVNLLFTVTDKKGRFMTDLKKEDFEITENKRPQKILEFTAESDLPLRLAILVDTSNSVRTRFRFIQDAAVEFINTAMRAGQDKGLVVYFDTEAQLAVKLTEDKAALDRKSTRLNSSHT